MSYRETEEGEGERDSRTRVSSRARGPRSLYRKLVRSGWFEAVLAVVILLAVVLGAYLYTQNWPPLVVVESGSMQHGSQDVPGLINAGDIVFVQKVAVPSGVVTYVQGLGSGYTSYGEYGDVILYYPNGDTAATPVVHRAILWLAYLPGSNAFAAPSLASLECGPQGQYLLEPLGHGPACVSPADPNAPLNGSIELLNVGWESVTVSIALAPLVQESPWSGYITLGDGNGATYDQSGGCIISCLVQAGWVWGVARGMIPWVGALKLWIDGDASRVPSDSWGYLGLTVLLLALAVVFIPRWIEGHRRRRGPPRDRPEPKEPGLDPDEDVRERG